MKKLNKKAFTLLELVVTIAIVAILAVLVLPSVNKQIDKAKFSKVKSDLDGYIKSVNLFYTDNNRYPTNKEELEGYITRKFAKNPYKGEYIYNGVGDVYLDITNLPQDVKIKLMNEFKKNSAIVDENYRYYFKASFLNKSVDELIQEEGYIPLANLDDIKAMDGTTTHTFAQGTQYEVTKEAGTYGLDSKYILVNDIALDSSYTPHDNFTGTLNGNGYKITGEGALFNSNDGEIINLELEGVNIENQAVVSNPTLDTDTILQAVNNKLDEQLQNLTVPATIDWNNIKNIIVNNISNVTNIEFRNIQDTYNMDGTYVIEYNVTFSDDTQSGWKPYSFMLTKMIDKDAVTQNVKDRLQQNLQGLMTPAIINWDNIKNDIVNNVADISNIEFRNVQDTYSTAGTHTVEFRITFSDDTQSNWLSEEFYVISGSSVVTIVPGFTHSLALMEDGTVKAWGRNYAGQLGLGDTTDRLTPTTIPNLTGVKELIAGDVYSFALMKDGTVKGWGSNGSGRLALGYENNKLTPTTIPNLTGVKKIVAGEGHSLALMEDGTVKVWGYNNYGQVGLGYTSAGVRTPTTIPNLTGVKDIVAGYKHSLALMEDGTVKAWGTNSRGQLGLGISTSYSYKPTTIPNLTGVKEITAGATHSFALMQDGTIKAWEGNYYGELGLGNTTDIYVPTAIPNLTGAKKVVASYYYTLAIMQDGTVKAFGRNDYGQLGLGYISTAYPYGVLTPTPIPGLE